MRAIEVTPGDATSARLADVPEPIVAPGAVLAESLALGVCGTDREIVAGAHGEPPPGERALILGHESLGRVIDAPPDSGLRAGDHVVGIVRRPDPVPCVACAHGEWDMCRNGRYTERGIKGLHGYGAERWSVEPAFAVRVDPRLGLAGVLLEPASIVAKAWEHVERIAQRGAARIERVLVTGAGPIGLLAALLGAQRDLDVHVLDLPRAGAKPDAVRALGATYHAGSVEDVPAPDVVIECTGVPDVIARVLTHNRAGGIVCLAGVSAAGQELPVDVGALNRRVVLENDVIFGSVNANRRHYEQAHDALRAAPRAWLDGLITRRVALEDWPRALEAGDDDIKVVIEF